MNKSQHRTVLLCLLLTGVPIPAWAAKISELSETGILEQVFRFFTFQDPSLRYALAGAILLGVTCGLLGSFIVVRKLALMGDALSHAVLPGVAIGFLWSMTKNPFAIFVGATIAGLMGAFMVGLITQTTKLKEDTALGMVLAGFFAVGICLVTMIQRLPTGNKSGIDKFLFGQAAAIGKGDVILMSVVTILAVGLILIFYKEFLITSFDAAFGRVVGIRVKIFHQLLMLLLAFSVVIALQAVGVVLVSAMLITPAAAAYLLTDRMHRMLIMASIFGLFSGVIGAFLSFLGNNLPTGPFMVIAASLLFAMTFLFSPRHGVMTKWWRYRSRSRRVQRENTLKSVYHVLENRDFEGQVVSLQEIAERRRETLEDAQTQANELKKFGLATFNEDQHSILLTPEGWRRAAAIVRNHRLWELYLTHAASIAADHVHDDAEKIEHVLGEDVVRLLEKQLGYATEDPHGKPIPSSVEIHQANPPATGPNTMVGYGRKQ